MTSEFGIYPELDLPVHWYSEKSALTGIFDPGVNLTFIKKEVKNAPIDTGLYHSNARDETMTLKISDKIDTEGLDEYVLDTYPGSTVIGKYSYRLPVFSEKIEVGL